jgi:calcium-dependent protein kinase
MKLTCPDLFLCTMLKVICPDHYIYYLWLLCQADADGTGSLDYGEFVALSVHLRKIGNDEHLHKAFAYFDRNESGYIEIDELRESLADDLGQNPEEVINAIIHDVDTDKVCVLSSS